MSARLTAREQEHLAVLRVTAMAADPDSVKASVRRVDLLAVLALVDRLVQQPPAQSVTTINGSIPAAFFAASITVHQRISGAEGTGDD
jgi:hypothetical protein